MPAGWPSIESRLPPRLKPGERVRLAPGGKVYTVVRVSHGSAQLSGRKQRPAFEARTVELDEDGHPVEAVKLVPAFESEEVLHVSAHAFVYRVPPEVPPEEE